MSLFDAPSLLLLDKNYVPDGGPFTSINLVSLTEASSLPLIWLMSDFSWSNNNVHWKWPKTSRKDVLVMSLTEAPSLPLILIMLLIEALSLPLIKSMSLIEDPSLPLIWIMSLIEDPSLPLLNQNYVADAQ